MKKTAEEVLSELSGIPLYRIKQDDHGEYITKAGALQAMRAYASQFKSQLPSDHEESLARNLAELQVMYGEKCAELKFMTELAEERHKRIQTITSDFFRVRDENFKLKKDLKPQLPIEQKWISVEERLPEIGEDGESDQVLCLGFKRSCEDTETYEVMRWTKLTKPDLLDHRGKPIEYGWSNRWWNTNPDGVDVHYWMPISSPGPIDWTRKGSTETR